MVKNNPGNTFNPPSIFNGPESKVAKEVANRLVKEGKLDAVGGRIVELNIAFNILSNKDIKDDITDNNAQIFTTNQNRFVEDIYTALSDRISAKNYSPTINLPKEWLEIANEIKTMKSNNVSKKEIESKTVLLSKIEQKEAGKNHEELDKFVLHNDDANQLLPKILQKTFEEGKKVASNIDKNLKIKKEDKDLGRNINKAQKLLGVDEVSKKNSNFKSQLNNIKKELKNSFNNMKNEISSHLPTNKKKDKGIQ